MARLQQKRTGTKRHSERINTREMREAAGRALDKHLTPAERAAHPFNARWEKRRTKPS